VRAGRRLDAFDTATKWFGLHDEMFIVVIYG
jgi:hypothetical protein